MSAMPKNRAKPRDTLGQPSWRISSDRVEAFVTRIGGHVAPVTFDRKGQAIQPFSVAPWWSESLPEQTPKIIEVLRGDFFCMPFGSNDKPYRGESHPLHGETANRKWQFESFHSKGGRTTLALSMKTKTREGRVDKIITLIDGHDALYCRHVISNMSGPMDFGHHAMLVFDDDEDARVSMSRFKLGQVYPGVFEDPENGGYSSLKSGAVFKNLSRVPAADGSMADLSRYPARRGFEDLVQLMADPKLKLAWTAVVYPKTGFVYLALRDPAVLTGTVLWHSNAGRHYPPWSGRHFGVLGVEDTTSFFHDGLAASAAPNSHTKRGLVTALRLNPKRPLAVNYIMAVAKIPKGFDRVKEVKPIKKGVKLTAYTGRGFDVTLDIDFLDQK